MKNSFLPLLIICLLSFTVHAQERVKEIGLSFSNFDNFGLVYRTGTSNALWRINSVFLNASSENREGSWDTKNLNLAVSAKAGREYRKDVGERFQFRYGFDLILTYTRYKTEDETSSQKIIDKRTAFMPGVGAVVGLNYVFKEKFVFGAELTPGIHYTIGEESRTYSDESYLDTSRDLSGFNFGLSTSGVMLTLAYRLGKS